MAKSKFIDGEEVIEQDDWPAIEKKKKADLVISKKAVRAYVKRNGPYITQVDKDFYLVLDRKVRQIIGNAISNNCSRKRLSSYELA